MLQVIIDAASVVDNLPHSIEAVVLPPLRNAESASKESREGYVKKAHDAHADFLRRYGLTPREVPLLSLDLVLRTDAPFGVVIG